MRPDESAATPPPNADMPGTGEQPAPSGVPTMWVGKLQAPAAWLFGGVAVVAVSVSAELGAVLVAVGLIAHAGWDVVLWRARRPVVARSFVEWCAAFDLTAGTGTLVTLLL